MVRTVLALLCVFATLAPAMCLNTHVGRSFPFDKSVEEDDKEASKKIVKERRGTTTPIPTTSPEPAASTSVPAEAAAVRADAEEKLKEAEGTVQEMQDADAEAAAKEEANAKMEDAEVAIDERKDAIAGQEAQSRGRQDQAGQGSGLKLLQAVPSSRSDPREEQASDPREKQASAKVVDERRATTTQEPTTTASTSVPFSDLSPAEKFEQVADAREEADAAMADAEEDMKEAEDAMQEAQEAGRENPIQARRATTSPEPTTTASTSVPFSDLTPAEKSEKAADAQAEADAAMADMEEDMKEAEDAMADMEEDMKEAEDAMQEAQETGDEQEDKPRGRPTQAELVQASSARSNPREQQASDPREKQANAKVVEERRATTSPEPTTTASTSVPFSDLTPAEKFEQVADAQAEADEAMADMEEDMKEAEDTMQEAQEAGRENPIQARRATTTPEPTTSASTSVLFSDLTPAEKSEKAADAQAEADEAMADMEEDMKEAEDAMADMGEDMKEAEDAMQEAQETGGEQEDKPRERPTQAKLVQVSSARSAPLEEPAGVNAGASRTKTSIAMSTLEPTTTTSTSVPFSDLTPCEKQEHVADARAEAEAAQAEAEEKVAEAEGAVQEMQDADLRATAHSEVEEEQSEAQAAADAAREEAEVKVAEAEEAVSNMANIDAELVIEESKVAAAAAEAEAQFAATKAGAEAKLADAEVAIEAMNAAIGGLPTQAVSGSGLQLLQDSSARSDPLEMQAGTKIAEERRATTTPEPTTTASTSVPFSDLTPAEKSEKIAGARVEADEAMADMEEDMKEAEDAMQEMQDAGGSQEDTSRENPIQARRATTTPEPTTAASTSDPVWDLTPAEKSEQAADAQAEADAAMADMEEDMKEAEDTIQEMQEAGKSGEQPSQAESGQAPSARTDSEGTTHVRGSANSDVGDATTFLQLVLDTHGSEVEPTVKEARRVAELTCSAP